MISAILLAAGSSKRMGEENKLLLKIGETRLIHKSLKKLLLSEIDEIVMVTGFEDTLIKDSISEEFSIKVVHNKFYESGMTSSIQCGVKAISEDATAFMVCLADMPLIDHVDLNRIIKSWHDLEDKTHKIVRPIFENTFGNPVLFSSTYRQSILDHTESDGCKEIIQLNKERVIPCEMSNDHIFRDIDTPEDYQQHL